MSRHYTFNGHRAFVYGYDRQLQYYFFQVMHGDEVVHSDDFGGCTAGELMEACEAFGVTLPKEHAAALALDIPIDENPRGGAKIDAKKFDATMAEGEIADIEGGQQ